MIDFDAVLARICEKVVGDWAKVDDAVWLKVAKQMQTIMHGMYDADEGRMHGEVGDVVNMRTVADALAKVLISENYAEAADMSHLDE